MDFLEEYFYYAFWLMSVSNERIRKLAIKIVYDIAYKKDLFIDFLMDNYYKIYDLYIKKGIIHVLTKLSKSRKVTLFIEQVYNDKEELDAEIIHRTATYLNKETEYQLLNKKNINDVISKNKTVDKKLNLNHIIFMAVAYEKNVLKFERFSGKNTLSLYKCFIINNNVEIKNYNEELQKKFSCIKNDGYCKYSIGDSILKEKMKPIDIITLDSERMFILFQEIFKKECNIYEYDCYTEEKFDMHLNKFEDSLLKKILLLSQDILLGSLMTNYYTEEFCIYNDEKTLGYKNYSYIEFDEEKFYLISPVSPYNELIDKLNTKLCETIELYNKKDYWWFKSKKKSIENCCKMMQPIIYDNNSWSLIGGAIHLFIDNYLNVSYTCFMAFNPREKLVGDENSRKLTIENKTYYGCINDYMFENYSKNMMIPNFESFSKDIKDTFLAFPSPNLIRYLKLRYNFETSSWDDRDGNHIIICDNNNKTFYRYPVTGAIYIKTNILNELKKKNNIVYWCFTEKLYKKYGWNEKASLHLELDPNGMVKKEFNNNNLTHTKEKVNVKCKKCKYGIYKSQEELSNDYLNFISNINNDNN